MELTDKKKLIKKWISLFGDSALFMLNVDIRGATGPDWSKMHEADFSIETNHEIPYGLYFTPSGNFGKVNRPGQKIVRSKETAEDYVPCLFFDLDLKDVEDPSMTTVDDLFEAVVEIIKHRRLPVNFLTKSGGGVHGYAMVEPQSRVMVGQLGKLTPILNAWADFFPGGDHRNLTIEKLMRCPFSNHWKTGRPIEVELYRVFREFDGTDYDVSVKLVESEADMDLGDFDYVPYEAVKSFSDSIKEVVELRRNNGLIMEMGAQDDSVIVNKLPIRNVMDRLVKYPRVHKMDWGAGLEETSTKFVYDGTHIGFEHTNLVTGEFRAEETMGYRINAAENYVHNFTFENHDIKERPRGPVYPFLYHYFFGDRQKIKEFLENEFHIKIFEKVEDSVMPTIISSNGVIEFTKKRVTYRKEKMGPKGLIKTEQVLFDTPVIIKGVIESKYSMRGELPNPVKYYVLHRPDSFDFKDIVVEFKENRIKFNQAYGKYGLIFKGPEEDLLDFYVAVNNAVHAGQVEKFDIAYLNGFHENYFLMGKRFIDKDFKITDSWPNTIVETQEVDLSFEDKEQVPLSVFGEKLRSLYADRVSMTALTGYVALFLGINYWKVLEKYKQQLMIPAMAFSGKTHTGKSTIITMLKEGSCLAPKARMKSVRSTTPQPMKHAATDPFILHLEEFTGSNISMEKESIIRDIINQAQSARGTLGGDNIQYVYRSSVILDGERLPSSKSVVNRCVVLPMFETDKRGTEETMRSIRKNAFLKDLVTKAFRVTDEEKCEAFLRAEDSLSEHMSGRQLMLYSFLLTVNDLFDIFPKRDLLRAVIENAGSMEGVAGDDDELSNFLADMFVNRRIIGVKMHEFDDGFTCEIPIPPEIVTEKSIDIIAILKKYGKEVKFTQNRLTLSVKTPEMRSRMTAFDQYLRNRF